MQKLSMQKNLIAMNLNNSGQTPHTIVYVAMLLYNKVQHAHKLLQMQFCVQQ